MIDNTINDAKTIAASGKDAILAGRYHIIRPLGYGSMNGVYAWKWCDIDMRKRGEIVRTNPMWDNARCRTSSFASAAKIAVIRNLMSQGL